MTTNEATAHLALIATAKDFPMLSEELVSAWRSAGVGIEGVEAILRFMEEHPTIDYGAPGALVHFAERFYGNEYEELLVASIKRKPTGPTVGMLNAVINGTRDLEVRQFLISILEDAARFPFVDPNTLSRLNHYLERLRR